MTPGPLQPGSRLGRYELRSRLASGGMADVWLAEATGPAGFRKDVVVKTILPRHAADPAFVRMFQDEARVAAALNHPSVVHLFDLGSLDGTFYIAMEHVHGKTLRAIQSTLRRKGRAVPPWLAFHVVMDVCDALDHAHEHRGEDGRPQGIVHCDVSPENVMLSFAGATKVLDFGIARALHTAPGDAGLLKGKYPYMAPERIRAAQGGGGAVDRRADVYSIGVILYELLAGQLPFQDPDELALLQRIVTGAPTPPRQVAAFIPEDLEKIILAAIARDPAARPQTAAALRDELAGHLVRTAAPTTTERHVARVMANIFASEARPAGADEKLTTGSALETPAAPGAARPVEAPAPEREGTVLVVDPDAVSRRFVELALAREGFLVEAAKGVAAALEVLQSTPIDLVLCEPTLADGTGLQLHRRLQKERRLAGIPFVFLGGDARVASKVAALRAGADDVLVKPCEPAELAARVRALVERARRARAEQARNYDLAGEFGVLPVPDLIGMLELTRRSGRLSVSTRAAVGEILLAGGRVVHVAFGNLTGAAAFYRLLEEGAGRFELTPQVLDPALHTMNATATELLLEGARLDDTRRRDAPSAVAPAAAPATPAAAVAPGAPFSAALAAQLELGVRDAYCLGELRLNSGEELAAWTLSGAARDRFHVHLVAGVAEGIAAMLPLATPPGEREILSGLGGGQKLLGLDFFLKNDRLLDVVLVDIRNPGAVEPYLHRAPSLVIVAPPAGDFAALGTTTRVGLELLLEQLQPPAVLGIGKPTLERGLKELAYLRGPGAPLRCLPGVLGEGQTDLRDALVEGLRLRAAAGA